MEPLPLEDDYTDVLRKAIRGRREDRAALAARAGLAPEALQALLDGRFDAGAVRRVAGLLGLGADALAALGERRYAPQVPPPERLLRFATPYEDGIVVNSYLVWDAATKEAALFDTGTDASGALGAIAERGLSLGHLFLTHAHRDHVACLEEIVALTGATAHASAREPIAGALSFEDGAAFAVGGLRVAARRTSGHARGGVSYLLEGLDAPVAFVGDALFAGSMGGGLVSYAEALDTNRKALFTLPDGTIVCPGHGPLTTVGLEKRHNPFYPEFRKEP